MHFISIRSHMNEVTEKTIDIDKVLADKMGKKSKLVPWFVKGWLRRTIHQDEVNKFLWESRDKKGVEWLEKAYKERGASVQMKIYPHMRHEILNEDRCEEVMEDILAFITAQ